MGIERLYNKYVDIVDDVDTKTSTGDVEKGDVIIYSNIKCRITNNAQYSNDNISPVGYIDSSSHIMFCYPNYPNIKKGVYVVDRIKSKKYIVEFVDDEPGGVSDHHLEIFLRFSNVLDSNSDRVYPDSEEI
jgi:hypothetical protein